MKKNDLPIGIFDSGVGGLTVVKDIIKELPNESLIYLGDTARIPYGTRSSEVVTKFALELANFLLEKKVKILVIACNTISANALGAIKKVSPVPVIDVINPTVLEVSSITKNQRVGLIATTGTIESRAYKRSIKGLNPETALFQQACPLFVPLAEEGITAGLAVEEIARGYLSELKKAKIDTLILGCTHFPLLYSAIAKTMGNKVTLVTSGPPTARKLRQILLQKHLLRPKSKPTYRFYFTDVPERVTKVAENFFGQKLPGKIKKTDL